MRFILLALVSCCLAGGASAAPERGRGHGPGQAGPTRVAVAPAATSTRGAVARQATSQRPRAQASRYTESRRPSAQPLSRHARGQIGRAGAQPGSRFLRSPVGRYAVTGARGSYYQATRHGSSRYAANCRGGSRCQGGERRFAWQSGLPQAAGVQTISCPSGTVETPAHGHTTIMRCLPI
ncbi:MAG: hypothetical protein JWO26_3398 [Rhodospirillales bacterium]|jgi:hypothetical protein|nr:hypothetical protein [Rhodospirillales bacterium]MDB5383766.1 hypothetical protein [Rhodospirillales bacterium]